MKCIKNLPKLESAFYEYITEQYIKKGLNTKKFYFTVEDNPTPRYKRGYNRYISICALLKSGRPVKIGHIHDNSAASYGEKTTVNIFLAHSFGYKLTDQEWENFTLVNKKIKVYEL